MLDVGTTLRRYRDERQYTQQYVANIIGISRVAYRKWENNEVDFAISQLKKSQSYMKYRFIKSSFIQNSAKIKSFQYNRKGINIIND